ncbi:MAG TPA: hypothetical protein VGS80_06080, partial [Ktedonobacterales bacterium]|nr:hypothetical protein [Ktedonobacterales bacterium]
MPPQRPQWNDEIVAALPLSVVVRSIPLPNGKRWYSIKIAELGPVAFGEGYSVAQAAASLQTRFSPIGINIEHLITAAISA